MAEYTLDQAVTLMRQARDAGDEERARRLAVIVNKMRQQPAEQPRRGQFLRQVNRGIADTFDFVGDAALTVADVPYRAGRKIGGGDFMGPTPVTRLRDRDLVHEGFRALGVEIPEGPPENDWQQAQRSFGMGAAVAPFAGAAVRAGCAAVNAVPEGARTAVTRFLAPLTDTVARSMTTMRAVPEEAVAAGAASLAVDGSEAAGAPEWAQQVAGIAAPIAALTAPAVVMRMPMVQQGWRTAKSMAAPFTTSGGREVARRRLQELAGGTERAERLASATETDNPLGLSPAQMTGDRNMLGLERLAAAQDSNLWERLTAQGRRSFEVGRGLIRGSGDPARTQQFFQRQFDGFKEGMQQAVEIAARQGRESLEAVARRAGDPETVSSGMVSRIQQSYDATKAEEQLLWEAIPDDVLYIPQRSGMLAREIIEGSPRGWQDEALPRHIREFAAEEGQYTFREIYDYYSNLRGQARAELAKPSPNNRLVRNANRMADEILEDLGAFSDDVPFARELNEARAFSRAMHETYDQGAVGRILQRTIHSEERINPGEALDRTIGRGDTSASVAATQLRGAVSPAEARSGLDPVAPFIDSYLRTRFLQAATRPNVDGTPGAFDQASAARFMRNNQALLRQFPELRGTLIQASRANASAEDVERAVAQIITAPKDDRVRAVSDFLGRNVDQAIAGVYSSARPAREARALRQEAGRDESGAALAGLKGAFALDILGRATTNRGVLQGEVLSTLLQREDMQPVLNIIFDAGERGRLRRVAADLAKLESQDIADVGTTLSGSPVSAWIETLARVKGAHIGTRVAGGNNAGTALQAAQIGSGKAVEWVRRLTSDKAAQLIADAFEDPDLFRALLREPGSPQFDADTLPRLLPYLVGGTVGAMATDEEVQ